MTHLTRTTRHPDHDPIIDDQLVSIGKTCLDLRAFPAWDAIMMGWVGCLTFVVLCPTVIGLLAEMVYYSAIVPIIVLSILYLGMSLGFSYAHIRHIAKYSNIRFNRSTGKVYATVHGQRCEADWHSITASSRTRLTGAAGGGFYPETTLNIHMQEIKQPPKYPKLEMRGILKPSQVTGGSPAGVLCLWEFICDYMENGPDDLMLRKPEGYLMSAYKISLPPKENFKKYFPWPITTNQDTFGWKVLKRALWPAKIIIFPVAFASQLLWHIMYTTFKGQFPSLPAESETGCDQNRLKLEDILACGDVEQRSMSYQQAMECKQQKGQ